MSQFSHELYKLESSNMVYICRLYDCIVGLRLRLIAHVCPFCPLFFFSNCCLFALKICITVFCGTIKARTLKLGIRKDNELSYCGIENQADCCYSSVYSSIFLSFWAKFVPQFSEKPFYLELLSLIAI